ncbi:MAG: hypothetical protein ACI4C1_03150 [Lachnospiraceae bacterium]
MQPLSKSINEQGSMTIELALLWGIVLGMLFLFLYLGLLERDRFVLKQFCRMKVNAYVRALDQEKEENLEEEINMWKQEFEEAMLIAEIGSCSVTQKNSQVNLVCEVKCVFPFFNWTVEYQVQERKVRLS